MNDTSEEAGGGPTSDPGDARRAPRFRLVDIPISGSAGGRPGVEQRLADYADDGWEAVAFDRLSVNGPITFLLRRDGGVGAD